MKQPYIQPESSIARKNHQIKLYGGDDLRLNTGLRKRPDSAIKFSVKSKQIKK